jgi:hypothetical protein
MIEPKRPANDEDPPSYTPASKAAVNVTEETCTALPDDTTLQPAEIGRQYELSREHTVSSLLSISDSS